MNWKRMSDTAIIGELGERIKRLRLQKNFTQQELADRAGIAKSTLQKLEYGTSATMITFIQVLRALKKLDSLDNFLPEPGISPIEMQKLEGKKRQRASKKRK